MQWMTADDWRKPEAVWSRPDWMRANATVIWLVRSDLVSLPFYQTSHMSTSSLAEHMQMLSEHFSEDNPKAAQRFCFSPNPWARNIDSLWNRLPKTLAGIDLLLSEIGVCAKKTNTHTHTIDKK